MQYIAFDSHKRYTLASVEELNGRKFPETRIEHERGRIKDFLGQCESGSPVAVETIGNWYWIIDEIEAAGMVPQLVHSRKAKLMLAMVNKTDKLDGVPRRPPFLWVKVPRWQLPVQPSSEECM
ncbi:MAG: hypothetical protein ACOC7P_01880 [Chloroflexota bacterium]